MGEHMAQPDVQEGLHSGKELIIAAGKDHLVAAIVCVGPIGRGVDVGCVRTKIMLHRQNVIQPIRGLGVRDLATVTATDHIGFIGFAGLNAKVICKVCQRVAAGAVDPACAQIQRQDEAAVRQDTAPDAAARF